MPRKLKQCKCTTAVPAALSHTGRPIEKGSVVEYTRVIFRNGEHYLQLPSGKFQIAVFFNV